MSCLVCHEQRQLVGVVCAECLDELKPSIAITPEQVRSRVVEPTSAVLVDPWGRVHRVQPRMLIGRDLEGDEGLCIFDVTTSRRHACLEARSETWTVRDFGSSNGTFVEGKKIDAETLVRDGERVRFGKVPFFFLDEVGAPPEVDVDALSGYTVRDPLATKNAAPPDAKELTIELREPTGGGGGVLSLGGKHVQLTLPQFELMSLLHQRARCRDAASGGFVHASELVRLLSLDSAEPNEDHVRQLVRRLRRVLFKAGIEVVIESRYGAGYRLELRPPS